LRDIADAFRRHGNELIGAADRAGVKAKDAVVLFESQTEALLKAANDAVVEAQRVRETAIHTQQDTFLKAATFIIETLQSIAVDLNRVLDQGIPDSVWKRYHSGDRGIFTRQLLQMQDKNAGPLIKKKFEEDPGFRDYVLRYLNQFETLLAQARECDHMDVLGATFVTADVGKLYLILSNAVGRLKN
jgi:hypothetical protein